MRLATDGLTPLARLVLVDDLEEADGYYCKPAGPLFLAPGDRILFDARRTSLVVTRASGETFSPTGELSLIVYKRQLSLSRAGSGRRDRRRLRPSGPQRRAVVAGLRVLVTCPPLATGAGPA